MLSAPLGHFWGSISCKLTATRGQTWPSHLTKEIPYTNVKSVFIMADFVRRSLFAHCTCSKDTVMVSSTRDTDVRRTKNIHGWNSPKTHGHLITHVPKKIYNCKQAKHSPHIFK